MLKGAYHHVLRLKVTMDNAELVEVKDRLGKLPEDNCSLVLLKEGSLAGVIEEIALSQQFSHDINVGAGLVLLNKLYYVRVVALLEDTDLTFEHLPLTGLQVVRLDYFYSYKVASGFLFSTINVGKIALPNTLQLKIVIEDGVCFVVLQLVQPGCLLPTKGY
jgi:hypothetical protein